MRDPELQLLKEDVNGPFRGLVFALPISLVFWIAFGLLVWAWFL